MNRYFNTIKYALIVLILASCQRKEKTTQNGIAFDYVIPDQWEEIGTGPDESSSQVVLVKKVMNSRNPFLSNVILNITPYDEYNELGINNFKEFLDYHRQSCTERENAVVDSDYQIIRINGMDYYVLTVVIKKEYKLLEQKIYFTTFNKNYIGFITTKSKSDKTPDSEFAEIIRSVNFRKHVLPRGQMKKYKRT